jgi:solute:Na+ symporter, SSS family
MILFSFVLFTGFIAVVTYVLTRNDDHVSSDGYFLAGRRLTGPVIAGSLLLTNLSTEQMVGLNGAAFNDGFSVMAWEVLAVVALVAMALFFLPRFLKSGIATVPQFLEERFDAGTRTITTFIFLVAYAAILLPIVLYTGARGLNGMLDMAALTGIQSEQGIITFTVWLVGIIGTTYAIFGGLRTVAVSDTLNGIGLLTGGFLIAYFGLQAVSGGQGIFAGLEQMQAAHPEKFNSIGSAEQSVPFPTLFTGVLLLGMFYWTTNQQIIQRTFGARNLREGQKGVLLCGALKLLGPLYLVLPGMMAFHLYGDNAAIKADMAYGQLVRDVLPGPLTGFFAAVMVGAILSSYNSALNSTTTLFSLGIYKTMINKDASEEQVVKSGKIFGWFIAIVSMSVAPLLIGQASIFGYLQKMNGLYFIPIFSVVVVGMLFRRVPAVAAKIALVAGFASIALGYFVPSLAAVVTRMHEFHFLGAVFVSLIAIMLIIGQLQPRATAWEQQYSGDVELTPWQHSRSVSIGLLVVVLLIYVAFADFSFL